MKLPISGGKYGLCLVSCLPGHLSCEVGMVSLKVAPVSMPSVAVAQFERCWEMGRALHAIFACRFCQNCSCLWSIWISRGGPGPGETCSHRVAIPGCSFCEANTLGDGQPILLRGVQCLIIENRLFGLCVGILNWPLRLARADSPLALTSMVSRNSERTRRDFLIAFQTTFRGESFL